MRIALLHTTNKTHVEELDVAKCLEEWKDRMQVAQVHLTKTKSQMINQINKKREHACGVFPRRLSISLCN